MSELSELSEELKYYHDGIYFQSAIISLEAIKKTVPDHPECIFALDTVIEVLKSKIVEVQKNLNNFEEDNQECTTN